MAIWDIRIDGQLAASFHDHPHLALSARQFAESHIDWLHSEGGISDLSRIRLVEFNQLDRTEYRPTPFGSEIVLVAL